MRRKPVYTDWPQLQLPCRMASYVWAKTFVFLLTLDRESTERCFLYACYGNPILQGIVFLGLHSLWHLSTRILNEPLQKTHIELYTVDCRLQ